jgi:hypothetical protein
MRVMGKIITYERWMTLYLPDGWTEREDMGFVLLEKEGWPGMMQLSFIARDEIKTPPAEAARILLEDTLEERDVPFPREAVIVENRGDIGIATLDYTHDGKDEMTHWRIWFLVDKTRAIMAAYVSDTEHVNPSLAEAARIIADIEFVPSMND